MFCLVLLYSWPLEKAVFRKASAILVELSAVGLFALGFSDIGLIFSCPRLEVT